MCAATISLAHMMSIIWIYHSNDFHHTPCTHTPCAPIDSPAWQKANYALRVFVQYTDEMRLYWLLNVASVFHCDLDSPGIVYECIFGENENENENSGGNWSNAPIRLHQSSWTIHKSQCVATEIPSFILSFVECRSSYVARGSMNHFISSLCRMIYARALTRALTNEAHTVNKIYFDVVWLFLLQTIYFD